MSVRASIHRPLFFRPFCNYEATQQWTVSPVQCQGTEYRRDWSTNISHFYFLQTCFLYPATNIYFSNGDWRLSSQISSDSININYKVKSVNIPPARPHQVTLPPFRPQKSYGFKRHYLYKSNARYTKKLKKKITGEDCYRIVCLIALYTKYHITKKNIIINQLIEF